MSLSSRPAKRRKKGFQPVDVAAAQAVLQQAPSRKTLNFRLSMLHNGRLSQTRATRELEDVQPREDLKDNHDQIDPPPPDSASDVSMGVAPPAAACKRQRAPNRAIDRIARWLPSRDDYLDEIIRWEGLGDATEDRQCPVCKRQEGSFRCKECFSLAPRCQGCIVLEHRSLPLHKIEKWTGLCYSKISLKELGLEVQLGHGGLPCPNPGKRSSNFVIGDITGFHHVQVTFCDCYDLPGGIIHHWAQCLRMGWYPATTHVPTTAFTFRLLDFFQELNVQGKTNLYDFHKTLGRVTDNSGLTTSHRYWQLCEAMRQWRNLMLLKRSGRAHDPGGANATLEGSAALDCPACPQPGRNLPSDWAKAPPNVLWLYTLYLMVDANFRLRLKDKGIKDLELAPGWAYNVNNTKFRGFLVEHFREHGDQVEKNTCSAEHNAILNANLRKNGYIASGVGAVFCARHALVRKNGVGDLQKGEKYVNMDYLILSTLIGAILSCLFISYDIACQYNKNFIKRMRAFPTNMQIDIAPPELRFGIPKQHWHVHSANHSKYSFNYLPNVGRTYGEGIESGWSHMNPISMSTREMGPAARQELLDEHWGAWNWSKIIHMGSHMSKCLQEAVKWHEKHTTIFTDYSATFPAATVEKWEENLQRWYADQSTKPDPFEDIETHTTMNTIRLRLAQEDAAELAKGTAFHHEISPSMFLQVGLEIEEQQRVLRLRVGGKATTLESISNQERRNAITRRIESWRKTQLIYTPLVTTLDASASAQSMPSRLTEDDDADIPVVQAEDVKLWLPSSLPPRLRVGDLIKNLLQKEKQLRVAQADDALADIRRLRRVIAGISQFKRLNVSGTGNKENTRIRALYDKFNGKVAVGAARYRAARDALVLIDPNGDWSLRLKVLRQEDIKGPAGVGYDDEDLQHRGEGRHEPSWIWLVPGLQNVPESDELASAAFSESMRVEWSKSKARMERWGEEKRLLLEEMRRVLVFLEWKAGWWRDQGGRRTGINADIVSGLTAYSERQAVLLEQLRVRFAHMWLSLFRKLDVTPEWRLQYERLVPDGILTAADSDSDEISDSGPDDL